MNSLSAECQELKQKYDACFNKWFTEKYMRGSARSSDKACAELLSDYRACVYRAIKEENIDMAEIDSTVLGTEKEKKPSGAQDDKSKSGKP